MADTIKIGNTDISSFKVGSSDCKIYLGSTLLYPHNTPPHTEVDSIIIGEYNGSRGCVVTDWNFNSTDKYEMTCKVVTVRSYPQIFGQKVSGTEYVMYQFGYCYYGTNSVFYDYGGGRLQGSISPYSWTDKITWLIGRIDDNHPNRLGIANTLDEIPIMYIDVTNQRFDPQLPLLIGETAYDSTTKQPIITGTSVLSLQLYSFKIYSENPQVLKRDYVPVRKNDGTYTLYDKITNTYATPYGYVTEGV